MDWQPIETAPQNGTEFQAWVNGIWEPRCRIHDGRLQVWERVDYDLDGWQSYYDTEASHWMPQPTNPNKRTAT